MIGFSTVAEPIFCRTPPSGCLYALLERKRMKEMKLCVFIVLSLTFFFVALEGSVGEITTNLEHFSLKIEKKLRTASLKQNLLVLIKRKKSVSRSTVDKVEKSK